MTELFFALIIALVFGAMGYYARIWMALAALLIMCVVVAAIRGVDSYTVMCAVIGVIMMFVGNRWALHRAYSRFRAEDHVNQVNHDFDNEPVEPNWHNEYHPNGNDLR